MGCLGRSALLVLGAAGAAQAQGEGTATWLWDVTTQDGDAVVEPGETASVTLSALMEPDKNWGFLALAATIFNVLGQDNADLRHIVGWEIHNGLADLTGDLTTTDGVSLFNINAGQLGWQFVEEDNPMDVITFEWAPDVSSTYDVAYQTATKDFVVWLGTDLWNVESYEWPVVEADIVFSVIPSPATWAALGASACVFCGRRRR